MGKIQFAHNLRGIAAIMVVFCHVGSMFFSNPESITKLVGVPAYFPIETMLVKISSMLSKSINFNSGAFGVALFFLISGFVIPFSLKKYKRVQFFITRFMRIIPTYAAGYFISCLAVLGASYYYDYSFPYNFKQIIANIFLVGDIFGAPSIDGVVWTLQIELRYYIICFFFSEYIKQYNYKTIVLVAMGIFTVFIIFHIGQVNLINYAFIHKIYTLLSQLSYVCFMFIGTIFHYLYMDKISKKEGIFSMVLLSFIFIIISYKGLFKSDISTSIYIFSNYMLAFFLFSILYHYRSRIEFNIFLSKLADISYSLYVVHAPISYVIMRLLLDKYSDYPYLLLYIALLSSVLLAFLINVYIENKTNILGKNLAEKL